MVYFTNKEGSTYDGDFKDNKKYGFGIEKWPDGAIYEGNFVDGVKEG